MRLWGIFLNLETIYIMKLIMEQWRKYLKEQRGISNSIDPCSLYKMSNILKDLEKAIDTEDKRELSYRISQALSVSEDIPDSHWNSFDYDDFLEKKLGSIKNHKKQIKGFMGHSLDIAMRDHKKMDQKSTEMIALELTLDMIYNYADALERSDFDFGSDSEIVRSIPVEMAIEFKQILQDYLMSNTDNQDERSLKDQCLASSTEDLGSSGAWGKSTVWCSKLPTIKTMVNYDNDKRNFPLPWKADGRKYILATRLDEFHGPIDKYMDCLYDHLSGDYSGRSVFVSSNDEFEQFISHYEKQGPQEGDYVYTNWWLDGKFI